MPVIKPRSKKKREEALRMADGGVVKPKTLGETIGYPKRMAHGGMVDDEDEEMSIAQAIRSRRMDKIQPEDPIEPLEPEYEELNEAAGELDESDPLSTDEGEDDYARQNRIAAIRRKRLRG